MTRLGQYLRSQGLNDAGLASEVGVTRPTITKIRLGSRRPSASVARRIEAATDGEVTAASLLGLVEGQPASRARPLNDGRWAAPVVEGAVMELPPEMLAGLGLEDGDVAIFRPTSEGLLVTSQRKHLQRIQDELRRLVPEDVSLADELIAERRAESAGE
ncbi:MAG: helix-turn-helix domain-containing protein [Caulobacter sp.]|nr:helix-turn-helix domain-containing protein [Caulobacter sp.]